jgi:hypothetical protein
MYAGEGPGKLKAYHILGTKLPFAERGKYGVNNFSVIFLFI